MNESIVREKLNKYSVQIHKRLAREGLLIDEGNAVTFLDVYSDDKIYLELSIQLINDEVYCIYFLNNQFFELSNEELTHCLQEILSGRYEVKGKDTKQYIITQSGIHPEAIENIDGLGNIYTKLPAAW